MPANPKLVSVITTCNRLAKLQNCCRTSLAEGIDQLVIVNNASTDSTREWLDSLNEPRIKVIHLPFNTGSAGGFHTGVKHALADSNADWLVIHDDDAWPQPGTIAHFRAHHAAQLDTTFLSAVRHPDGHILGMNRPLLNPFQSWRSLWQTLRGKRPTYLPDSAYAGETLQQADMGTFLGLFVPAQALRASGILPRPELFLYSDDYLFTLDLTQRGMPLLFDPHLRFTHDFATFTGAARIYKPAWRAFYNQRNAYVVYRQACGWAYPLIALARTLGWLAQCRHYPEPLHQVRLSLLAAWDGVRGDLKRGHESIANPGARSVS